MIYFTDFYVPLLKRTFWIAKGDKGICYVDLNNKPVAFKKLLSESFDDDISQSKAKLKKEVSQILEYFAGKRKNFDLRVFLTGTFFQTKVWVALSKVKYGKTISYSELAELAGNKNAVRAAATCCALNPVPIIIPCQRVIAKDGSIGGFGGGVPMKRKMLELERVCAK
ncbi:MAG: methylated-DNA--[protein]-cysteine S-methyltransferase [Ignavibacteria bacterium]|nr:methylated-DNA--[protein]-cysteine S-methyltransferase [Ignavibacteria bacterium]